MPVLRATGQMWCPQVRRIVVRKERSPRGEEIHRVRRPPPYTDNPNLNVQEGYPLDYKGGLAFQNQLKTAAAGL